ncbi:FAD-dependent monooxygenase [Fodinicola acaciae]|uniref:FAD-dependent monooxygenase n=1 Tax=Fodinicola acaciae TaxID=2681555 RepID=UPI0013CF4355|nr:FAD-dependent monooxygenase [Fodinicola acaciae]
MDVIVVGAGPTGLMLARELRLAGVRATVLEKSATRSIQSKAGGLHSRTAEVFRMRGLLEETAARAQEREQTGGHFAALPVPLDFAALDTRSPYVVATTQGDVEDILERGLAVEREREVVGISQDADRVRVRVVGPEGPYELTASYLVACDGGHSTVRKLLEVPFPGRAGQSSMVLADVLVDGDGVPTVRDHFSRHVKHSTQRAAILSPLPGGFHRLMFGGPEQRGKTRTDEVTADEVRAVLADVYGPDVRLRSVRAASRFSDASRQVESYRVGQVFLAGDAAHVHLPTGGQGMNLGLQDAFNLGWKLAAAVRGDVDLLDTYHAERHPVGARVLLNTRAQGSIMDFRDLNTAAMRTLLTEWLAVPELNRKVAAMISGLDIRYDLGSDHPLVGARMPDRLLETADGSEWFSSLAVDGRGVLIDFGGRTHDGWGDRVRLVNAKPHEDFDAAAVLVRPDGHVAWLGDDPTAALTHWFGAAR